ncbi:MAG: multiheme c-type cytochrome, partial [Verrucomicrobiota bacterium]
MRRSSFVRFSLGLFCFVTVKGFTVHAQTPSASPVATAPAAAATPAATASPSNADELLVPAPSTPATSSDDDLLLPSTGTESNQPMPDDLLLVPNAPKTPPSLIGGQAAGTTNAAAAHAQLLVENKFPSASTCATCHPTQFRQWSVSQHAYAQLSPVFNTMQATIEKRTSGTNGDFCIRCHTQVGMQLQEPVFVSNMDRNPTSREGISCIVCH